MKLLQAQEWEQLADLGAKVWVDGPRRPPEPTRQKIREQVYAWLLDSHHRANGTVDPQGMTPPAVGRLSEIKAPTLVIWGDKDFTGNLAAGETLASTIKGARKEVFEDTAHMVNLERPEQFNRVVRDFLQRKN